MKETESQRAKRLATIAKRTFAVNGQLVHRGTLQAWFDYQKELARLNAKHGVVEWAMTPHLVRVNDELTEIAKP